MKEDSENNNMEIIKRLLIVQLVLNGVSIREIMKITKMSSGSIYKFLPKNLIKKSEGQS